MLTALISAPTKEMGAEMNMRCPIKTIICICCTSLVVRVIKDAVEILSNSACEKLYTLLKMPLRRSRAAPMALRELKKEAVIEQNDAKSATPSMISPVRTI